MIKRTYPVTLRRRLKELQPPEPAPAVEAVSVVSPPKKSSTKNPKDNG